MNLGFDHKGIFCQFINTQLSSMKCNHFNCKIRCFQCLYVSLSYSNFIIILSFKINSVLFIHHITLPCPVLGRHPAVFSSYLPVLASQMNSSFLYRLVFPNMRFPKFLPVVAGDVVLYSYTMHSLY